MKKKKVWGIWDNKRRAWCQPWIDSREVVFSPTIADILYHEDSPRYKIRPCYLPNPLPKKGRKG